MNRKIKKKQGWCDGEDRSILRSGVEAHVKDRSPYTSRKMCVPLSETQPLPSSRVLTPVY